MVSDYMKKQGEENWYKVDARQVHIHEFEITRIEMPEIDFRECVARAPISVL